MGHARQGIEIHDHYGGGVVGAIVIALVMLGPLTLIRYLKYSGTPPKPYDVAMYDVYSDLITNPDESGLLRLIAPLSSPRPEGVLIRAETLTLQEQPWWSSPRMGLVPDKRFEQDVDAAIADYLKRNTSMRDLQRKFNLPHYDLFTEAEIDANPSVCKKYAGYVVGLSAVGFNQDQTVAVVYIAHPCMRSCDTVGYRMLQKWGGRWYLLRNRVFFSTFCDPA